MDKCAGIRKISCKVLNRKPGAGENLTVQDSLPIRRDQCLHGKSDPQELPLLYVQRILKFQYFITYRLKIRLLIFIRNLINGPVKLFTVQIDRDHLHFFFQDFHTNADPVVSRNGIGGGLSSYIFGIDLTALADQPFLLHGIQVGRDRWPAQPQVIGNVLLRYLMILINIMIDQASVVLLDLIGGNALFHDGTSKQ